MKLPFLVVLVSMSFSFAARAAIIERRLWIDTAVEKIKEQMCSEKMKAWRCIWTDSLSCQKVMKEVYPGCAQNVLPDLPEYIDGPDTEAKAQKIVKDCMMTELAKKYVLPMTKARMDEYNLCTGAVKREKPLNPNMQKALDASKATTANQCSPGSFYRKCYSLSEQECADLFAKQHLDCSMQMEKDGVVVKSDEASIQDTSQKITECALQNVRKALSPRPKLKDKECE